MALTDHTYASAIVGAQKTHKRKAADFYPTPSDVTVALLDFLAIEAPVRVWEPACGDGAMSKVLTLAGHEVHSTDLREDSGYGIGGVNFMEAGVGNKPDWIITNPPFNVAEDFIEHALSVTPNVAMLLKSQFWHARRREPLFRNHPPAWILPLTWRPAFLEAERGSSPLMDVIWVVWTSNFGSGGTLYSPLVRPSSNHPLLNRFSSSTKTTADNIWGDLL